MASVLRSRFAIPSHDEIIKDQLPRVLLADRARHGFCLDVDYRPLLTSTVIYRGANFHAKESLSYQANQSLELIVRKEFVRKTWHPPSSPDRIESEISNLCPTLSKTMKDPSCFILKYSKIFFIFFRNIHMWMVNILIKYLLLIHF